MTTEQIIEKLPYQEPFLFVDQVLAIANDGVTGCYTLRPDSYFYKGHFKDHPITPGVILTEIMAQIGLVCLGIFLSKPIDTNENAKIAMTHTSIDFYKPVYPGEKVTVTSKKVYFRFNKLKCNVQLHTTENVLVAKGVISGMITNKS